METEVCIKIYFKKIKTIRKCSVIFQYATAEVKFVILDTYESVHLRFVTTVILECRHLICPIFYAFNMA